MMNWNNEMEKVVEVLTEKYVTYGEGCEKACEHCPYCEQCDACEGWWGCDAWEKGMGDDL